MKLDSIITLRKFGNAASYKIVYEWEDILAKGLNIPINYESFFHFHKFYGWIQTLHLANFYKLFKSSQKLSLFFVMTASNKKVPSVNRSIIPVIIDFWLKDTDLPSFYSAYKGCPLVLITNYEVYDMLIKDKCPLAFEHWPLSYPNNYKLLRENMCEKEYEFTIIGRPNPFFIRMLDKYCETHPDFTYIMNNGDIDNRKYINHKGEIVADGNTREDYLNMIKKTKISCYTTPGFDEAKSETSKFNQVTPRLFELLANGCQVIGHYPNDGLDVLWYNLPDLIPNVHNYEDFEKSLDRLRNTDFDYKKVNSFLEKHYTSTRTEMLISILNKHNIKL